MPQEWNMLGKPTVQGEKLIEAREISRSFGGLKAVSNYSLDLNRGELHGLIGPNGAGKTTVFNLITGVLPPSSGEVRIAGHNLTGKQPWQFARAGIARTFQNIRLFPDLNVLENVMCGCHAAKGAGVLSSFLRLPGFQRSEAEIAEAASQALELVGIAEFGNRRAGALSYGDQRRTEIARALASNPKILMLDEPAAGLNPTETSDLIQLIARLNADAGLTIVLVEHDMRLVMQLCRQIQVLNRGQLIAAGTPQQIQANPAVIEAYLGLRRKEAGHA